MFENIKSIECGERTVGFVECTGAAQEGYTIFFNPDGLGSTITTFTSYLKGVYYGVSSRDGVIFNRTFKS